MSKKEQEKTSDGWGQLCAEERTTEETFKLIVGLALATAIAAPIGLIVIDWLVTLWK